MSLQSRMITIFLVGEWTSKTNRVASKSRSSSAWVI